MQLDEAAWAEIERAYCGSDELISAIAARCNVSVRSIQRRAQTRGWPRRSQRLGRPVGSGGPDIPVPPVDSTRAARAALERRLYRVMIKKLERLEMSLEAGTDVSAVDSERQMREIGTMIRGFEKVKEVGADDRDADRGGSERAPCAAADVERMRAEIAQRLERLMQRRNAERGSGGADRG